MMTDDGCVLIVGDIYVVLRTVATASTAYCCKDNPTSLHCHALDHHYSKSHDHHMTFTGQSRTTSCFQMHST